MSQYVRSSGNYQTSSEIKNDIVKAISEIRDLKVDDIENKKDIRDITNDIEELKQQYLQLENKVENLNNDIINNNRNNTCNKIMTFLQSIKQDYITEENKKVATYLLMGFFSASLFWK